MFWATSRDSDLLLLVFPFELQSCSPSLQVLCFSMINQPAKIIFFTIILVWNYLSFKFCNMLVVSFCCCCFCRSRNFFVKNIFKSERIVNFEDDSGIYIVNFYAAGVLEGCQKHFNKFNRSEFCVYQWNCTIDRFDSWRYCNGETWRGWTPFSIFGEGKAFDVRDLFSVRNSIFDIDKKIVLFYFRNSFLIVDKNSNCFLNIFGGDRVL